MRTYHARFEKTHWVLRREKELGGYTEPLHTSELRRGITGKDPEVLCYLQNHAPCLLKIHERSCGKKREISF